MDWNNKTLRCGALALGAAVLLRLLSASPLAAKVQALGPEDLISMVLFLEAGRVVTLPETPPQSQSPGETVPETEPALPSVTHDPQLPLTFSPDDLALVEVNNLTGYDIDPAAVLQQPLSWDLTREGPAVLILHTHATESYRNTEDYDQTADYRTLDPNYNMISVGEELARVLREGGIQVIHDTRLHDNPSYNEAYGNSRQAVTEYLERYPSIRLVLDLHRDSAQDSWGEQIAYTSTLGGEAAAQLMLVMGTDAGGLSYPQWQENLSVALRLQTILQRNNPGICRPLSLRAQRYNQDLHPGYLLVEVGAAGNQRSQALLAAQALGQGILDMACGTVWPESATY